MGNTEVETIGVRLTLDASGFAGGADKATASMNAFSAAAEKAVSGAAGMKAMGGAQVAAGGRSVAGGNPASMAAVNVPLTVNAESLAALRTQIIKGLGTIPISVTLQKAISAEAKAVVSAVSTPAIGTRSGAARAVETAVRNNLPTRAHGGAVQQGRDVLVGERGPEIYRPRASGTIFPDANAYHREQMRLRKQEAELAALEYQIQQRGRHRVAASRGSYNESEIRRLELLAAKLQGGENISGSEPRRRGGIVRAYGGRTVYSSEGDIQHMTFLVNGEVQTFHGTTGEIMDQVRGLQGADIKPWRPQREQFGPRGVPSAARVFVTRAKRMSGGRVSPANALRRTRAFDITHRYGNVKNWQNEMWRQQEAAEMSERLEAAQHEQSWADEMWRLRSGRAQGGPAHKGGLPRGYHIEFYSPRSDDVSTGNYGGRLDKPGPGFKSIKKPVILAKDYMAGIVAVVKKGDKIAATFPFSFRSDPEQWGVPTPYGFLHPNYSITGVEHRRKGLATAAYVKTERFTGRPIAPSHVQLSRGKAFWDQPDRPFGKIFGPRPREQWEIEDAERDTRNDELYQQQQRRFAERRQEAAAAGPGPVYSYVCPRCGTAAGPYHDQRGLDIHMFSQHGGPPVSGYIGPQLGRASQTPAFGEGSLLAVRNLTGRVRERSRRQLRNDPQEQMRRISYGENGPWTATSEWRGPLYSRPRVPQPAPTFGEGQFIPDRPGVRFRARGGAVEISRLPGGGGHYAPRPEGYYRAIQDTINHYQDHSAPGGYVGIAPIGKGVAVQLHGPGGEIESWRILRNLKHAGFGALAYRATMANEGGTFPLSGGPQPPKGYAVGIATGTSHLVEDAGNYRDFLKQFHAQRKSQIAAGNFPPYVGTWLHEGQIHIDPAAVLGRRREADMVARAKAQQAFFDLKRFDEIPTSSHRLRATAERIQQLIMAGHREGGGAVRGLPVENVSVKTLLPYREIDRESHPRYGRDFEYLDELTETIRKEGIKHPLEVWYSPGMHAATIADGNHRLAVAQRLGMETVPTTVMVPRGSRLRGAHRLPGDPFDLSEGFYAPSEIGLRQSGGPVGRNKKNWGFVHKHRIPGEGTFKHFHGGGENHSHGSNWHPVDGADGGKWIFREDAPKRGFAHGGLVHAKQGSVASRMTPGELDFVGNLRAAAAQISPDQLRFGKVWYADAQRWINEQARRYGIDPTTARGVTAALSAGTAWGANKTKAHRIFQTHERGLFGESFPYTTVAHSRPGTKFGEIIPGGKGLDAHLKAKAILEGADPESILGHTPKVGAFYRNLGGDLDAVTLDRWAYRTATRGHLDQYGKGPLRRDIDAAYRKVAAELGLHPVEFQAAAWLYEREANPRLGKRGKPESLGQLEAAFSPMREKRAMGGIVSPGGGMLSSIFQTAADWANDPFMAIMAWQQQQAAHKARGGSVWTERRARRLMEYRAGMLRPERVFKVGRPRLNEDFAGPPLPFTGGHLVGDRRWADTMGHSDDPERWKQSWWARAVGIPGVFPKQNAAGGNAPKGLYIVGEIGKELFVPNRLTHLIPKQVMDQIPKAKGGMQVIGEKPNSLFSPPEDGIIVPNRLMHLVPHRQGGGDAWPGGIPRNPLMGMDRLNDPSVDATMKFFLGSHGRVFTPPPAYGVAPGYKPDPMVAASTEAAAALGKVTASGAEASGALAKTAVSATVSTKAAGLRLRPGFENIEGIAVPKGTPAENISALKMRLAAMKQGPAETAAVAEWGGFQTAAQHAADYEKLISKTIVGAPRVTRVTRSRISDELAVQMAGMGQTMPSRTPRGAVAAIGSYLFGGVQQMTQAQKENVQARQRYEKAAAHTDSVINRSADAVKNLRVEVAANNITQKDAADIVKNKLAPAVREARAVEKKRSDELIESTKKTLPTVGGVLKNLGVIIGATSAYGMAMQVASTVITDAALPAAGKWVDEITGFGATATRVTTDLAKATQAGNWQQAISQAASTAGLGTAGLAAIQNLIPSVIAKAGATAAGQAMDLRRAAYAEQAGNAPTGLYGGTGGLLGSSLFAEQLGGTKGFLENVAGEAAGYRAQYGEVKVSPQLAVAQQLPVIGGLLTGAGEGVIRPDALKAMEGEFSDYNEAVKRGATAQGQSASSLKLMTKETLTATKGLQSWDAATDNLRALAKQIGGTAPDEIEKLLEAGGVIVDQTGKAITNVKDLNTFLTQAAQGAAIASPQAWASANLRQIQAQLQMSGVQAQRQQSLQIPYSAYTQLLQQPLIAPGAGLIPGATTMGQNRGDWRGNLGLAPVGLNIAATGASKAVQGLISGWVKQQADAQTEVNSLAKAGSDAMRADILKNVGPDALAQYDKYAASATKVSNSIKGITEKADELQATSSSMQWAESIYLAGRSLSDALGAIAGAGIKNTSGVSGAASQLGIWQGMSHKLDIMNQTLSLQLQQRQITTALAQAQFSAPGQTGEERYFAQVEAIQKAAVAQKQLNIGVEQLDLGQKIWNENANRAARDAQKTIDNMHAAQDAATAASQAEKTIADAQKALGLDMQGMDTLVQQSQSNWSTVTGAALQGISQFAGALDDGINAIYTALNYTSTTNPVTGAVTYNAPATGLGSTGTPTVVVPAAPGEFGGTPHGTAHPQATGFLGSIGRATEMIVGEAGPETVAIIRNARSMMDSGPTSVALTDTNITAWMRAIQTSFPKVGLTDPTIASWVKALQGGFPAVDLSDKTIAALGGTVAGGAAGGAAGGSAGGAGGIGGGGASGGGGAAGGGSGGSTGGAGGGGKGSLGLVGVGAAGAAGGNVSRAQLAQTLAGATGLDARVAYAWLSAENSAFPTNPLGVLAGNSYGSGLEIGKDGRFARYKNNTNGVLAAAWLLMHGPYAGVRKAISSGDAAAEREAIIWSPWAGGNYNRGTGFPAIAAAKGLLGMTAGRTNLTVGEANGEAVAILRNPRSSTLGSSGVGPMNLTINISGTSVRNDQDITELARCVAAEVEKTLARKGQMFGLRGPAV